MVAVRRHQRSQADPAEKGEGLAESKALELPPEKVARLYAGQVKPLRIRGFLAAALAAILVFLSYGYELGMTMPGALSSMRVLSLMCMLIVLAVIMLGLDIFTNGIVSSSKARLERNPGCRVLSPVHSRLHSHCPYGSRPGNALLLRIRPVHGFAILGARYTCEGYRTTFRTLAMSKSPYVVTSEQGISEGERTLIKSRRGYEGLYTGARRRTGKPATPFLPPSFSYAPLSWLFSLGGKGQARISSIPFRPSPPYARPFSALLAFPLPFSITARRLLQSGAAMAGYAGASDISRSPRVIVTDTDIFPAGTMTMESIHILEGYYTDKVISYTGSVMAASGAGLSAVFTELMRRNGCTIHRVENFSFHEGGGIEATVRGEQVYVGSSGYMNLMGIRLPRKLNAKNAVFAAINGSLWVSSP